MEGVGCKLELEKLIWVGLEFLIAFWGVQPAEELTGRGPHGGLKVSNPGLPIILSVSHPSQQPSAWHLLLEAHLWSFLSTVPTSQVELTTFSSVPMFVVYMPLFWQPVVPHSICNAQFTHLSSLLYWRTTSQALTFVCSQCLCTVAGTQQMLCQYMSDRMSEWMNEGINDGMNERVREEQRLQVNSVPREQQQKCPAWSMFGKSQKNKWIIELGQIIEGLECLETFLCLFILFNIKVAVNSSRYCGWHTGTLSSLREYTIRRESPHKSYIKGQAVAVVVREAQPRSPKNWSINESLWVVLIEKHLNWPPRVRRPAGGMSSARKQRWTMQGMERKLSRIPSGWSTSGNRGVKQKIKM